MGIGFATFIICLTQGVVNTTIVGTGQFTYGTRTQSAKFKKRFKVGGLVNCKISRVPDLGKGKNKWVQIWLDLERREFGENLALLSEEFKFWSFPDPARSELFRNLTITDCFDISHWFHAINIVIDALSWISINVYLTQCMHSIYFIMKIEVHYTVSDKNICSVSLIGQLYLRILSALNLN